MNSILTGLAAFALVLVSDGVMAGQAAAQRPAATQPAGDAKAGRDLFVKVGCYECHGYSGQGGETGPRLAPGVIPLPVFNAIVRSPPSVMPAYRASVLTDAQVADLHAYLTALPKPRTAQEIPILRSLSGPRPTPPR